MKSKKLFQIRKTKISLISDWTEEKIELAHSCFEQVFGVLKKRCSCFSLQGKGKVK